MIVQLGKGKGGNGSESDRATAGGEGDFSGVVVDNIVTVLPSFQQQSVDIYAF